MVNHYTFCTFNESELSGWSNFIRFVYIFPTLHSKSLSDEKLHWLEIPNSDYKEKIVKA